MGPASIASMAFNLAINVCFGLASVPKLHMHQGKFMAANIAFSLADFFVQLFLGGKGTAEPQMVGVTSDELKGDLDILRSQIAHDLFDELKTDKLASMQTLEQNWKEAWDAACVAQQSGTGDPIVDAQLNRDWNSYYDSFKAECNKPTTVEVCNWLALNDKYKFETIGLYTLAAGLYLNMCQLCLLIEFSDILSDASVTGNAYQVAYDHWATVDMPSWRSAYAAWELQQQHRFQIANPGFGNRGNAIGFVANDPPPSPEPPRPSPPFVPPTCFDELVTSPFANHIRSKVKLFIAYADPIVTALEAKVAKRAKDLADRIAGITVAKAPSGHGAYVLDSITGFKSEVGPADEWKVLEVGIARAGLRAAGDPALAYVTDDDVKNFRGVIDKWRECENNYALHAGT
jgi:hypothetical protein